MPTAPTPTPALRRHPGAGRRERVRRIRRRVVTWTVVAFVALWGAVYMQMRAGNDPVLGAGTSAALVSARTTTGTGSSTSTSTTGTTTSSGASAADDGSSSGTSSSGTSSSGTSSSSSSGTSSSPAAVSTSQS